MILKVQYFMTATDLTRFVSDPANAINAIVSITFDATSAKYVLFFN